MIIVCNATPLISLAAISQLPLLERLFKMVYIPQAVYAEIKAKQAFGHKEVDAPWIQVKTIQGQAYLGLLRNDLDRGEAEAILLAKEMRADALVIDERMGYQIAQSQGIRAVGTLTILLMAKKAGFIESAKPLLDEMMDKGRWYSQAVYRDFLHELLDFLAFLRYRQQPKPAPQASASSRAFEIYSQLDFGPGGDAYYRAKSAKY